MDPLLLALVAVGGSIFGVWLGHQFQFRREDRRWRADKKLDAYVSFVSALTAYQLFLIRRSAPTVQDRESLKEELERITRELSAMTVARSTVELVGTTRVVRTVEAIRERTDRQIKAIQEAKPGEQPGLLNLESEGGEFIAAARADLGFPRLKLLTKR
jgi:hypothetical protein